MLAIFKRELKGYFANMTGLIFITCLLCFSGIFTTIVNLYGQSAMFEYALSNLSIVLLLVVPILAMRSVSEDKHNKTDKLLYSLPIKLSRIVIAKYLALLTVYLISVLAMIFFPFILSAFGIVNYSSCLASLLGFFLLGAALLSIAFFVSSLTESQVIAAVISFAVIFAIYIMDILAALIPASAAASYVGIILLIGAVVFLLYHLTQSITAAFVATGVTVIPTSLLFFFNRSLFEGLLPRFISSLAAFDRFYSFVYGIFDLRAVVYYLSIIIFFVFLTVQTLEKKRWA